MYIYIYIYIDAWPAFGGPRVPAYFYLFASSYGVASVRPPCSQVTLYRPVHVRRRMTNAMTPRGIDVKPDPDCGQIFPLRWVKPVTSVTRFFFQ